MTNEELISKYYDGNMQALYDLYEQNVGFIQSVAAAVAKDYKNYLRFSDTFEDLVQVGSLTFFEKLKAKKYDARKGSLLTYLTRFTLKLALSFSRNCLKTYQPGTEKFSAENMVHSGMKRPPLTTLRTIC